MDWHCPQGNCPTHTTVAKFQASPTRNPWNKPYVSTEQAQYKPPYSLQSENSEISDKKVWKKKKKQCCLEYERAWNDFSSISVTNVNGPNIANTPNRACKALS